MQSFVCIPICLDIFNRIPYNIVTIIPFRSPTMKKRILWIIISFNFIIFPLYQISHATDLTLNNTPAQVCFSPKGGCTEAIVSQIDKAKTEILVQAYSFTSAPIAKALLNAHKRGIKVEVILDKSQRREEIHLSHLPCKFRHSHIHR